MTKEEMIGTYKMCSRCGELKPLDQYHGNRRHKDGKESACALCRKGDRKPRLPQKMHFGTAFSRCNRIRDTGFLTMNFKDVTCKDCLKSLNADRGGV